MEVRFWAATDTGRKRGHNEDNFLVDRSLRLFVVCDGMGGHAAGEVASAAAIQTVRSVVEEGSASMVDGAGLHEGSVDDSAVLELLERAVQEASRRVWEMAQDDESRRGMGTTCSLIMFVGHRGFVAHVGDSRIYRMREESVAQLTDDHSLRNHLIREGKLGEDERLDRENAVTRAVGVAESIEVDTFGIDLEPGDRFVVCSDGLTEYLDAPDRLLELASGTDLEAATDACIEHANDSGGKDNVTALVVEVDEGQGVWDARQSTSAGRALRVLPHFQHLTIEEFGVVSERVDVHEVDAGTRLVEASHSPEGLMLIVDGRVELSRDGEVVDVVRPGDFFGERALLGAAQGGMCAETVEPSTVAVLSRSGFESILAESQRLAAKVSWNFLIRLMGKLRHLDEVEFRNPQLAAMTRTSAEDGGDDSSPSAEEAPAATRGSEPPEVPPETETTVDLPGGIDDLNPPDRESTENIELVDEELDGPPDWDPDEETIVSGEDGDDQESTDDESTIAGTGVVSTERNRPDDGASSESGADAPEAEEVDGDEETVRETVKMEDIDSESINRD